MIRNLKNANFTCLIFSPRTGKENGRRIRGSEFIPDLAYIYHVGCVNDCNVGVIVIIVIDLRSAVCWTRHWQSVSHAVIVISTALRNALLSPHGTDGETEAQTSAAMGRASCTMEQSPELKFR